ncbi:tubulin-folding cofactor B-like [Bacillus rossius redtenbacheri]|uniref:tubulin-folding cofactor B-like n=1 Tax=Bacillus rossius redtenbacheri TaxID=93214 RepID=UPI002FDEEA89
MANFKVITEDIVNIIVSNSEDDFSVEKRYKKSLTVKDLKNNLELVTGCSANSMKINVYDSKSQFVCFLANDDALLGSYPVDSGMRLHVTGDFAMRHSFGDKQDVEKFQLSDDLYSKRSDTVRAYLERNKLGKYNEEEQKKLDEKRRQEEQQEEEAAKKMKPGDRCEVAIPGKPVRRGCVRFVGKVEFSSGWWVGVQYDEPFGKHDGMVNGVKYFECPPKYGSFVKPAHITVGDFPEETAELDEI